MITYILLLFSMPAFAGEVRWASRLTSEVRQNVDRLRACGVEGRALHWKEAGLWSTYLMVTRLPARVNTCDAPWIFLRDREALARLREFTVSHEGLLLNLRPFGSSRLVRTATEKGFARLRRLETALGEAVLIVRPESDFYDILAARQRFDDYERGSLHKDEERFRTLGLPSTLLEPTLKFVREARVGAVAAHALLEKRRDVEYRHADDSVSVAVGKAYREQRLGEVRHAVWPYALDFTSAYVAIHAMLEPAQGDYFQIFLNDAVGAADFRALGLASMFPNCAAAISEDVL